MKRKLKMLVVIFIGILVGFFLLLPMLVHHRGQTVETKVATHQSQATYLKGLASSAQSLAKAYGIKPSILLGQIALTSDYGQTILAHDYHNLLALESCTGQDFIDLRDQDTTKRYAVYSQWEDSVLDYLERLKADNSLYETLATTNDYKELAKVLQTSVGQGKSTYAEELIKVIETYGLTEYDN